MKRKFTARFIIYIFILLIFSGDIAYAIQDQPENGSMPVSAPSELKAASAILAEADRGQVLYEKNSKIPLHISAACKLMTILLAVESGDLTSNVTISKDSVDAEGSALSLEVGKKYRLEDLLDGIMLTSANDAAKAVAEQIAGDTNKFVAKMNDMAVKLNMTGTHFTNSTGLYDDSQFTTANDISLLIEYAIENPDFKRIFSIQYKPWNDAKGNPIILTSQNKLFWSYDGVDGGKTGYNNKEQQTVIVTATRGNMKLICIVLDSPESDMFNDTTGLLDYGYDKFKKNILIRQGEKIKTVSVEGNNINLVSQTDVSYVHPVGESYIKEFSTTTDLQLPVKKNKLAGTARYVLNDGTVIDIGLYPDTDIIPPDDFLSSAKKKIMDNRDILYLVIFLLLIEVILILYNIIKLIKRLARKIIGRRK